MLLGNEFRIVAAVLAQRRHCRVFKLLAKWLEHRRPAVRFLTRSFYFDHRNIKVGRGFRSLEFIIYDYTFGWLFCVLNFLNFTSLNCSRYAFSKFLFYHTLNFLIILGAQICFCFFFTNWITRGFLRDLHKSLCSLVVTVSGLDIANIFGVLHADRSCIGLFFWFGFILAKNGVEIG